ncbi:hypothetical protein BMF94_4169 [Rhodotorula taiwanensis]|uniref:F-box domain-containing protein n=1 Tax=Rhodotorula taiwanensis TaxID=741276 RepID=A0A2S5B7K6_9BASI|nr:hypothetical protein BMF94_4169 [Rhodotorula taiwanensis]
MPKTRSSGKGKEVPYSSPEPRGPSSSATSRGSTSSRSTRRANSATATASVAATITMGDDFGNFQPVASTSAAQPGDTRRAKRRRDDDWDPTSGTATAAAAPASSRSPKKAHKGGRPIKVKGTASRKLPVANGVPGLSATTAIPAVSSSHAQADLSGSIYAFAGPSKREARDSPSLSPPASYTFAARIASVSAGPTKAKAVRRTPQPVDHLTQLPRELLQHIFSYIAAPLPRRILPPVNAAGGNALAAAPGGVHPQAPPDRNSLVLAARVCRELLPLARAALYRDLVIETRVQAHTLHRTLHANELSREVRHIVANVEAMARTSSQWTGWFVFHSMHSLCGIISACRTLQTLTLYMPSDSAAWTQSLCHSLGSLGDLHTLIKDLHPPESSVEVEDEIGTLEGMPIGWATRKNTATWAVSQLLKPLATLIGLRTLRISGLSSDSSMLPSPPPHNLHLTEVVLVDVNITNMDLMQVLGEAKFLRKFTLWGSSLLSKRGLVHVLRKCPSLVELRVGGSWFGAREDDEKSFPLNDVLPLLRQLKLVHVSGALISPAALEIPSVALDHLFIHACPAWTPSAVHASLSKMSHDPPAVKRLTLPAMEEKRPQSRRRSSGTATTSAPDLGGPASTGNPDVWNETWRFTARKTGEAKGCIVEASMFGDDDDEQLKVSGRAS